MEEVYVSYTICKSILCNQLHACGGCGVATKRNFIEILSFKHSHKHFVFVGEGEKTRNKVLKNHNTVSVVIDLGCRNIRDN